MRLNPPTLAIFAASALLALMALVTKFALVPMPRYFPHQEFWLAIAAYVLLMLGNVVRGI